VPEGRVAEKTGKRDQRYIFEKERERVREG
jgi:hypothetical protein